MPNTCKSNGNRSFGMLTSGARVSNTWVICPGDRDNTSKGVLIPDKPTDSSESAGKGGDLLDLLSLDEPAAH